MPIHISPIVCLLTMFLAFQPSSAAGQTTLKPRTPYHLQVNDGLEIKYRYTPQYDEVIRIRPDGQASMRLAGDVQLVGLTVDEAKALILQRIGSKLVDPEIDLELTSFEKPYFVVAGQVASPGRYDLAGTNVSVVEAIAQAGGFKSSAKNTKVIVYHKEGEDLVLRYVVDCKKVMQHPDREVASMAVHSGDVVVVPQNTFSSVERVAKLLNLGVYYPLPQ
jgi:polysaccharide biosynthesis/export protein